jgi:hypothetical protein
VTADYLRRHGHHLHLSRADTPPIELHFCAYAGFGIVLPSAFLMDRAQTHQLTDTATVLVPAPEDEFVYLATHAAGHSFIRLMWLYDLKLLVRAQQALDWDEVGRRAEAFGVASAVAYTVRLLQAWLGVEIPLRSRRLQRRGVRSRLADRLLVEVSTPQPVSVRNNLGGLVFTSLLCDRPSSSVALMQHHLLRSTRRKLKRLAPDHLPESWSA